MTGLEAGLRNKRPLSVQTGAVSIHGSWTRAAAGAGLLGPRGGSPPPSSADERARAVPARSTSVRASRRGRTARGARDRAGGHRIGTQPVPPDGLPGPAHRSRRAPGALRSQPDPDGGSSSRPAPPGPRRDPPRPAGARGRGRHVHSALRRVRGADRPRPGRAPDNCCCAGPVSRSTTRSWRRQSRIARASSSSTTRTTRPARCCQSETLELIVRLAHRRRSDRDRRGLRAPPLRLAAPADRDPAGAWARTLISSAGKTFSTTGWRRSAGSPGRASSSRRSSRWNSSLTYVQRLAVPGGGRPGSGLFDSFAAGSRGTLDASATSSRPVSRPRARGVALVRELLRRGRRRPAGLDRQDGLLPVAAGARGCGRGAVSAFCRHPRTRPGTARWCASPSASGSEVLEEAAGRLARLKFDGVFRGPVGSSYSGRTVGAAGRPSAGSSRAPRRSAHGTAGRPPRPPLPRRSVAISAPIRSNDHAVPRRRSAASGRRRRGRSCSPSARAVTSVRQCAS